MHTCVGKLSNLTVTLKSIRVRQYATKCLTNGYFMSIILKIRNPYTNCTGAMCKSVLVAMCNGQLWPFYVHALGIMMPWLNLDNQDAPQGTIQFKARPIFGCYTY